MYKNFGGKQGVWSKRLPLGAVVAKGEAKVGHTPQENTIFASHGSSLAVMLSALKHTQGQLIAKDVLATMQGKPLEKMPSDPNNKLLVSLANSEHTYGPMFPVSFANANNVDRDSRRGGLFAAPRRGGPSSRMDRSLWALAHLPAIAAGDAIGIKEGEPVPLFGGENMKQAFEAEHLMPFMNIRKLYVPSGLKPCVETLLKQVGAQGMTDQEIQQVEEGNDQDLEKDGLIRIQLADLDEYIQVFFPKWKRKELFISIQQGSIVQTRRSGREEDSTLVPD